MDLPHAGGAAHEASAAVTESAARGAMLRRTWLDVASRTMAGVPPIADLLESRLAHLEGLGMLDEPSLLRVAEEATQLALESGSAATARTLSKQLRRGIYEFLLAQDAMSVAEGAAAASPTPATPSQKPPRRDGAILIGLEEIEARGIEDAPAPAAPEGGGVAGAVADDMIPGWLPGEVVLSEPLAHLDRSPYAGFPEGEDTLEEPSTEAWDEDAPAEAPGDRGGVESAETWGDTNGVGEAVTATVDEWEAWVGETDDEAAEARLAGEAPADEAWAEIVETSGEDFAAGMVETGGALALMDAVEDVEIPDGQAAGEVAELNVVEEGGTFGAGDTSNAVDAVVSGTGVDSAELETWGAGGEEPGGLVPEVESVAEQTQPDAAWPVDTSDEAAALGFEDGGAGDDGIAASAGAITGADIEASAVDDATGEAAETGSEVSADARDASSATVEDAEDPTTREEPVVALADEDESGVVSDADADAPFGSIEEGDGAELAVGGEDREGERSASEPEPSDVAGIETMATEPELAALTDSADAHPASSPAAPALEDRPPSPGWSVRQGPPPTTRRLHPTRPPTISTTAPGWGVRNASPSSAPAFPPTVAPPPSAPPPTPPTPSALRPAATGQQRGLLRVPPSMRGAVPPPPPVGAVQSLPPPPAAPSAPPGTPGTIPAPDSTGPFPLAPREGFHLVDPAAITEPPSREPESHEPDWQPSLDAQTWPSAPPAPRSDSPSPAAVDQWPTPPPSPRPEAPAAPVEPPPPPPVSPSSVVRSGPMQAGWQVRVSPRQLLLQQRMAEKRREEAARAAEEAATRAMLAGENRKRRRGGGDVDTEPLPDAGVVRRLVEEHLGRKHGADAGAVLQRAAVEVGGREVADLAIDAGDRCRALGQMRAATNCYLAGWRADPHYEAPLWRLADVCLNDQEIDLAVGYLERIADLMRLRDDEQGAISVYRKIVTVAPERTDVRDMLATARSTGHLP